MRGNTRRSRSRGSRSRSRTSNSQGLAGSVGGCSSVLGTREGQEGQDGKEEKRTEALAQDDTGMKEVGKDDWKKEYKYPWQVPYAGEPQPPRESLVTKEEVEEFIRVSELDTSAAQALRQIPPEHQMQVIDMGGPGNARNPSAIVFSRIRDVQKGLPPRLPSTAPAASPALHFGDMQATAATHLAAQAQAAATQAATIVIQMLAGRPEVQMAAAQVAAAQAYAQVMLAGTMAAQVTAAQAPAPQMPMATAEGLGSQVGLPAAVLAAACVLPPRIVPPLVTPRIVPPLVVSDALTTVASSSRLNT